MNVHQVVPDPQKWIQFYKSTLGKRSGRIQRGSGGTLGPLTERRRKKGVPLPDVVTNNHW